MKKLLLQPNWDVIPQESGVRICHPDGDYSSVFFDGEELVEVFSYLIAGVSETKLLNKFPASSIFQLLSDLKKIGAVVQKDTAHNNIDEKNYLDLLNNHVVGADKIVRQIIQCPIREDNPFSGKFYISYATGFAPRVILHQSSLSGGWGADTDWLLADIKSVVEAVERYALAEYDEKSLIQARWEDVKENSLTASQLGTTETALESARNILWEKLGEIDGRKSILAPLDFLHHPVDYEYFKRNPIAPLNISGVAAHQSIDAAITNGLLELCEHEALTVAWYGQRSTPCINPESLDTESQEHIKRLEKMGWKVILKDISLDLVPVVMAAALGPVGKRGLTIGSCAAFSSQYAAKKALTEVIRTILVDEATSPVFPAITREEVNDVLTHGYYYADHKNLAEAEILWSGNKTIGATDFLTDGTGRTLKEAQTAWETEGSLVSKEKEYVTGILRARNIHTYFSEITPRQVREAHIPLFVVRTLAPEMARMTVGYNKKPAQTKRFTELLLHYGTTTSFKSEDKLHPFS